MFDDVAVEEVVALDPNTLSEGELAEATVEIMRLRSALEAGEAAIVAACDRRRVCAADGRSSTSAAWLDHGHGDVTDEKAGGRVP